MHPAYTDPQRRPKPQDPPLADRLRPEVLLGSLFLSGFAPVLRGTAGTTVAAVGLGLWMKLAANEPLALWGAAVALCLASLGLGKRVLRRFGQDHDPSWFVMDEAAAFALLLALLGNPSWADFCFAFIVFRFYDIAKPWPVSSFELLPRSAGILADDLAAACLGAWTIWTVRLLAQVHG